MPYKIKEMRREKNMSQEELSQKSHVSRAIISQLEQPESKANTTTDTLIKIADTLGCSVTDIFCH